MTDRHVEVPVPLLVGEVEEVDEPRDADDVDDAVDAAERGDRVVEHALHVVALRGVARPAACRRPLRRCPRPGRGRRRRTASRAPFAAERVRGLATDALTRADHHEAAVVEAEAVGVIGDRRVVESRSCQERRVPATTASNAARPPMRTGAPMITPADVSLDGKTAIVTGGARGIGRAIALGLASFGADVAVCDRDEANQARDRRACSKSSAGSRSPTVLDVRNAACRRRVRRPGRAGAGQGRHRREQRGRDVLRALHRRQRQGRRIAHRRELRQRHQLRTRRGAGDAAGRVDHQRHVDRGPPRCARLRRLRGHEGRGRQPHEDPRARARTARHPRERHRARRDPHAGRRERSATRRPRATPRATAVKVPLDWGDVDDCAGAAVYLASNLAKWVTGTTLHVDGGAFASSGWVRQDDGSYLP